MGGKSKPTIGYWYRYLMHFGISQVLDALLEVRGGEKTAWAGRAEGGTIAINARELWGGEKAEGGIEGELDVMLGHGDQVPSARLAGLLGDQQSAYHNRASVAFEGLYGAFNPYPKAPSFKGVRIFEGWEDDTPWYPEKAEIAIDDDFTLPANAEGWEYVVLDEQEEPGYVSIQSPTEGWATGQAPFAGGTGAGSGNTNWPIKTVLWVRRTVEVTSGANRRLVVIAENGCIIFVNGDLVGAVNRDNVQIPNNQNNTFEFPLATGGTYEIAIKAFDEVGTGGLTFLSVAVVADGSVGMNPAHMIYDSVTHSSMQGEPIDLIDEASFTATADVAYAEGFGLCTKFNPVTESVENFQKRVLNAFGANLARSRVDGKWYLTAVRGVHDIESLPILEDDDILEYEEEPSDPLESVNQVSVEWFDPVRKKKRTTTPLQSLGAIQSAGGIIAEIASYPEIPSESLALRVAARDLAQKSAPLKRFRLTTNRVPYAWRAGQYFRLQAPRRGIADMVCMVGEIDAGTPRSGSMRLVAIQDVSGMPSTVYVSPEPGVDTSPSQVPVSAPAQQLLEAPYLELAGDLPAGELASLAEDAGFILVVAARPSSGLNYTLFTAAAGESLADRGSGDWCPTALITEFASRDPNETDFSLEAGSDLSLVELGSAALWGAELVRVDAIDLGVGIITLGRGCGDTTPQLHAAGERIWFYDTWAASDRREYAGGETVSAKALTRTSSRLLDPVLATTMSVELDDRAARPYPPGDLRISDDLASDAVDPAACQGELTVAWAHRDRLQQADQLVDATAADIGPEAGTTYTVRYYLDDVLEQTESGLTGTAATPYTLPGDGLARVEVEALRDGLTSWQAAIAEFDYATVPDTSGDTFITEAGDTLIAENGNALVPESSSTGGALLSEAGDTLTTEAGDRLTLE